MTTAGEGMQVLLDQVATAQLSRPGFLTVASAAGLTTELSGAMVDRVFAAGENHAANQTKAKRAYDYIIIGSGAPGSIIAGELSKTAADVLVVESGGEDASTTIGNPSIWFYNVGGPLDWTLPLAPVPKLNNRLFNMALGHVLGGGSSVNAMVWTCGTERDYDTWERDGATGWGFKDVLPIFKAQENWEGGPDAWRGADGPVHVTLLLNTHVTRILFEGDRASGVEVVNREVARIVEATREVILTAGTIHSAKLPMLSGVGDAMELRKWGIVVVANLPGVGQNLQDHVLVSGVAYQYRGKILDRAADSNGVEAEVYLSSGVDNHPIDISVVLEQVPIATPEATARFAAPPKEGFTIAPALVQHTGRGQVRLASANWRDAPVIEANHLGIDHDVNAIVKEIEAARELGRRSAFDQIREMEVVPGPHATSRQDLIDLARTASASFGHAVGTAKIGSDANAVVDSNLRVHGLEDCAWQTLRSCRPLFRTPGTNASSYMIGGSAADLIKAAI